MRKVSLLAVMAALAFSPLPAFAGPKGHAAQVQQAGGFAGPVTGAMADTVAKAKELPDDAPVVLTGTIVSQVAGSKNKFIFKDQTGEITVEIKRKAFQGINVTPEATVRISGKVDKDLGKDVEIDAKWMEVVKQ